MADSLSCHLSLVDTGGVLVLDGEVDVSSVRTFVEALAECDGSAQLIVDLSAVRYMDSSGLHALEQARERFERGGGRLTLRAPSAPVATALRASGLAGYFDIQEAPPPIDGSQEEVWRALRARAFNAIVVANGHRIAHDEAELLRALERDLAQGRVPTSRLSVTIDRADPEASD